MQACIANILTLMVDRQIIHSLLVSPLIGDERILPSFAYVGVLSIMQDDDEGCEGLRY